MSVDQNRDLVRRFYGKAINLADLEEVEARLPNFIAPDYLDHNSPDARGPAGYLEHLRALRNTFPDFQLEVLEVIAEGEWVACRVRGGGTHREHYGEADTFGMLLAMGLKAPPGPATPGK